MTVHDAEPGDVYVDEGGKLWRCVSICHEPTLVFEEVEPRITANKSTMQAPARVGLWNGWKRIWRKPKAEPVQKTGQPKAEPVQKTGQQWQDEYNKANGPLPG